MKTYNAKPGEIARHWYVVDADGQDARPARDPIADQLRGKGKPEYTPHVDTGDFVIVVNAEKIAVTGNKLDQKRYYRHSGYPGGIRSRTLREQLERRPDEVLRVAVKGMLPKNRLARQQITKLKIYAGPEHPHGPRRRSPLESGGRERDRAVPRHRQAQDLGRPRDPAARRGSTWFNGRTIEDYFPRSVGRRSRVSPLQIAGVEGQFDIRVRVHGGGLERTGGSRPPRHRPRARRGDPELRIPLKRAGLPDARRTPGRAQEGRPAQGAQGAAVLEAVALRFPHRYPPAVPREYFGTDGVRGIVGESLTADLVERLGQAATLWSGRGRIFVGRDTRASGPELEEAFARGIASVGGARSSRGVLPTPAVALLRLDLGVVISASHNPPEYNGVKFFDRDGQQAAPMLRRRRSRRCSTSRRPAAARSTASRSRPTATSSTCSTPSAPT